MRRIWNLIALLLVNCSLFAQSKIIEGRLIEEFKKEELTKNFHEVKAYQLDAFTMHEYISDNEADRKIKLSLDKDYNWELELFPMDVYSEDARIRALTKDGEINYTVPRDIAYYGQIVGQNQSIAMLVIHDQFISGYIDDGNERILIESAISHLDNAPGDIYLVYRAGSSKIKSLNECGEKYFPEFVINNKPKEETQKEKSAGTCYTVELGIATDNLLYIDQGSTIQGVIDHIVSVMADVALNYQLNGSVNFIDGLEFKIVEHVVSTCLDCDEWTSSTDSGELLDNFTSWGTNSGFNYPVDMGQFWSDRNFDGSTVGLAWRAQDLLCNGSAFHVLQNFTTDANLLRVMTAHEIGHNLNSGHDGTAGFIMSGSVSNTSTWSETSKATISTEINDQGQVCMEVCAGAPCSTINNLIISNITSSGFQVSFVPSAEGNYKISVRDEENRTIIHTQNTTLNSLTISPANYEVCKFYEVIVENDCGSSLSGPVSVLFQSPISQGCSKFSADKLMDWSSLTVNFTDESLNAVSWLWDFGDGNTSTSQNPSHTYAQAGYYTVELTVNTDAHTMTKLNYLVVLPEVPVPYTAGQGGNMDNEDFGAVSLTSGKSSLWERGVASNHFTNSTNAWVTDLDANLVNTDNLSILYSPMFDFSSQGTYTFSFDLGMQVFFCNAPYGLQVQYSSDGGTNWNRLGSDTDPGWYNRGPSSGCKIVTSLFADEMGWTKNTQSTNHSYDVSFLGGNPSVSFRFVFNIESGWSGLGYDNAGAMIDNVSVDASLPVDLVSFDGNAKKDMIQLKWQTLNEINNDFFLVEKSFNGKDFFAIDEVNGVGNTFDLSEYGSQDLQPVSGINYYRLTQFDLGGKSKTYEVIAVAYGSDKTAATFYPNPTFGNELNLDYLTDHSGKLQLEIYDFSGLNQVQHKLDAVKGVNHYIMDISALHPGIYLVKINGEVKDKLVITR